MSSFTPRDPDWLAKVTASFTAQGFMGHIGAELMDVHPGRCTIRLPFRPAVSQQHGFFHGGVIGTLADNAGGYAGGSLLAAGVEILTVEYKLNIIAPGKGDALEAVGHVVKNGRSLIITRVDIFAIRDGQRHLCAIAQQTLMPVDVARVS